MPDRTPPPRLLLLGLVLGLAGLLAWFGAGLLGGRDTGDAAAATNGGRAAAPSGSNASAELASPRDAGPAPLGAEPVPEAGREAAARSADESRWVIEHPGDVRWVEGRLILPLGTPADEEAWVVAVSRAPAVRRRPGLIGLMTGGADLRNWLETERDVEHTRAPIASDGRFRLPYPKNAPRPHLDVDGRYVRLDSALPVRPVEEPVPIDVFPVLGGWIQGELIVPGDAVGAERDLTGGVVWLVPDDGDFSPTLILDLPRLLRSAPLRGDGGFEFRGVDASHVWTVTAQSPGLSVEQETNVALEEGGKTEITLRPSRGAGVAGTVVDDGGNPVDGAVVTAQEGDLPINEDFGLASLIGRRAVTGRDGAFFLGGLAAGEVRIQAERPGYRKAARKKLELTAGEIAADVVLRVRVGRVFAGRVVWPDGAPATDAEVSVVKASLVKESDDPEALRALDAQRKAKAEVRTDAEGRFEVPGLPVGSHRILALASRRLPGGAWEDGAAELVEKPTSRDLVLELGPVEVLSGSVIDAAGQPVPRFEVAVTERGHEDNLLRFLTTGEGGHRFEGRDGRFRLLGLPDGEWNLVVRADGFSVSRTLTFGLPRALSEPELRIQLLPAAAVEGVVLLPDGRPAAGARVVEHHSGWLDLSRVLGGGEVPVAAVTGPDGTFSLSDLDVGTLLVHAELRGYAPSEPVDVALVPGEVSAGVSLRLLSGGRITGEVLDREGNGQADVEVNLSREQMMQGRSERTDGAGRFTFETVDPGTARLFATLKLPGDGEGEWDWDTESATVQVEEGQTVHVVLGGLLGAPVHVRGQVLAAGEPAGGVSLQITPADSQQFWADSEWVNTDGEGHFEVELEGPGPYVATLTEGRGRGGGTELRFVVPEGHEYELVLELPAGRISGHVRGPDGGSAEGVTVMLIEDGRLRRGGVRGQPWRTEETDEDGGYSFERIAPGEYAVQAGGNPMGFMLGGGGSSYGRSVHSGLLIEGTEHIEHVDFDLSPPVVASGTVVDAQGIPVASATVFARTENGVPVDLLSGSRTDASGHFEYKGLAPGSYTFHARKDGLASRDSRAISVGRGVDVELELVIVPATTLEVLLRDSDGTAIACELDVRDESGWPMYGFVGMDSVMMLFGASGQTLEHRAGPLPPGRYDLRATSNDGRVAERSVHTSGERTQAVELRLD